MNTREYFTILTCILLLLCCCMLNLARYWWDISHNMPKQCKSLLVFKLLVLTTYSPSWSDWLTCTSHIVCVQLYFAAYFSCFRFKNYSNLIYKNLWNKLTIFLIGCCTILFIGSCAELEYVSDRKQRRHQWSSRSSAADAASSDQLWTWQTCAPGEAWHHKVN